MATFSDIARDPDGAPIGAWRLRLDGSLPPERVGGVLFDADGVVVVDGLRAHRLVMALGHVLTVEPADPVLVAQTAEQAWLEAAVAERKPWAVRGLSERLDALLDIRDRTDAAAAELAAAAAERRNMLAAATAGDAGVPLGALPPPIDLDPSVFPPGTTTDHMDAAIVHRAKVLALGRRQLVAEARRLRVSSATANASTKTQLVDLVLSLHGWPLSWPEGWAPPALDEDDTPTAPRFPNAPAPSLPAVSLQEQIDAGAAPAAPPPVLGIDNAAAPTKRHRRASP